MRRVLCGGAALPAVLSGLAAASQAGAQLPGARATEAVAVSAEDRHQAINAFNDKLDSIKNEGTGLFYSFVTAESDTVWSGQVEGRPGSWATRDTAFPIASASKLFTALAVMRTMEVKPRDWYPGKFVNEFKGWEGFSNFPIDGTTQRANLTVHQLLTHTSGLPFGLWVSKEDVEVQTLFYEPGTAFGYTIGHRVLGWVLRDYWSAQPETRDIGIKTVQDTYKWLIFDKLELSCSTRFMTSLGLIFGFSGEAGDAALQSTGEDLAKLAVLALRRGRLPNGRVLVSEKNWNRWAVPNLLPGGKLSKDLVSWRDASASWENWNVDGLKAAIMRQSGAFGWNYFGATYFDSREVGWCGMCSSCLRVTYPRDLAFVLMQDSVSDFEGSKPYLISHFDAMARSLQCGRKTGCSPRESSSIFCEECGGEGGCRDRAWSALCPRSTERGKVVYPDTFWLRALHTCYVPRCSGAPSEGESQCQADSGGTCSFLDCYASRGPTNCFAGSCLCKPGFCAQEGVCRPRSERAQCCRDTGGTCFVWGCHASRGRTRCVEGHCICDEGLCAEAGHCVAASEVMTLLSANASGAWQQGRPGGELGALGGRAAGLAAAACAVMALSAAAFAAALGTAASLLRWRRGGRKDDAYEKLLG